MFTWQAIVIGVVCGIACAYIARAKGRSPLFWFLTGLTSQVFGVLTLMIMPNCRKKETESQGPLGAMGSEDHRPPPIGLEGKGPSQNREAENPEEDKPRWDKYLDKDLD